MRNKRHLHPRPEAVERRLIYHNRLNTPSRGPELPSSGPLNRLEFGESMVQDLGRRTVNAARDPANVEHTFMADIGRQGGMMTRMERVSALYRPQLEGENGLRQRILKAVDNAPDSYETTLEQIMDAVGTVPSVSEEIPNHRYFRSKTIAAQNADSDPTFAFETKFRQIDDDRAFLEDLKISHPRHARDFAILSDALEELARQDKRYNLFRYQQDKVSFTDEAVKHFGRTTLLIAASAAALITGIIAAINKKSFLPPLLFAGIAAFTAKPQLWQSIFGNKSENIRSETNSILNNQTFQTVSNGFGVRGAAWRNIAETIVEGDGDTAELITLLNKNQQDPSVVRPQIEEYVRSMVPGNDTASVTTRQNLQRMVEQGHFPWFVDMLRSAKTQDARQIVYDYIELDCGRYAHDEKAVSQAEQSLHAVRDLPPAPGNRRN